MSLIIKLKLYPILDSCIIIYYYIYFLLFYA